MKELEVFRYLKKYRTVIAVASLIMGGLFFLFAQFRLQSYTATTVIEYTGSRAAEGLSPDGTPIDTSEIYATNIISQAMSELGMGYAIDSVRKSIRVEPIITETELMIQESKIDKGEDDYKINPTRYQVSFTCGVRHGKEYPRKVLNQILQDYAVYYGKNHVNSSTTGNPVSDVVSKEYDYIEMAEVIDDTLLKVTEQLLDRDAWDSSFRSSETGYSFRDLYDEFIFIKDVEVRELFSKILGGRITKNRDVLLDKYRNRNNDLKISNDATAFEIERIENIITAYEESIGEFSVYSDDTITDKDGNIISRNNIPENYVLSDVYGKWDENAKPVDRTTEYDLLLMKYIADKTSYEHNLINDEYNDYIIKVFSSAQLRSSEQVQQEIINEINHTAQKINELYLIYCETNDEFNEYLGAQNIMVLSSVRVTESFPIPLFTAMVIVLFGAVGCVGAVLLGRVEDFVEYYAFTNKVDGLPNRAKCDQYIALRQKKPVSEKFACIVLKVTNLQAENTRLGRNVGDKIMKDLVDVLTSIFPPSDKLFIGNNGAGQYLIFTETMESEQIKAAIFQLNMTVDQRFKDEDYHVELQNGYACANEEKCYYIRELLSIAIKRTANVSFASSHSTSSDTPSDVLQKEQNTPNISPDKVSVEERKNQYNSDIISHKGLAEEQKIRQEQRRYYRKRIRSIKRQSAERKRG